MEHSLMKDSGIEWIGSIPENWSVQKIKNLVDSSAENSFIDGDWIDSPFIISEGIRYLTTGNIGDGVYKDQGSGYISEETFLNLDCKYAYPGDLVLSRLNAPHGRSCILPNDFDKYVLAVDNVILRPNKGINKKYICYVTQCQNYQQTVSNLASGTTLKRISRTKLGNILIPIPNFDEQTKIANYLDSKTSEIKSLIDNLNKQIESLKEYKKSLIYKCVTKGLDDSVPLKDSGIEWIGSIPENWIIRETGNFYRERVEKVSATDYQPLSVTKQGVVPQLETAAKSDDFDNRKLVRKNDFAINSRSDRRGSCGISEYDGSVSLINTILEPLNTIEMSNKYFEYVFHTDEFADEFYKWGHGIVDDLWTTKWQEMKKITLPCPPLDEQINISNYLNKKCLNIDSLIFSKQKAIDKLNEYQKSLIYEYVTGKKEVIIEGLH